MLFIAEVCIFVNVPYVSTSADIDECKSTENVCVGHGCINLLGSYRCECQAGYLFNSIGRVCEGKQSLPSLQRNQPHWTSLRAPMSASNSTLPSCLELFSQPLSPRVLDVNECRHFPGRLCAHKCENTPGSYQCSCTTGFKLASDGRNCEGNFILDVTSYFRMLTHAV